MKEFSPNLSSKYFWWDDLTLVIWTTDTKQLFCQVKPSFLEKEFARSSQAPCLSILPKHTYSSQTKQNLRIMPTFSQNPLIYTNYTCSPAFQLQSITLSSKPNYSPQILESFVQFRQSCAGKRREKTVCEFWPQVSTFSTTFLLACTTCHVYVATWRHSINLLANLW